MAIGLQLSQKLANRTEGSTLILVKVQNVNVGVLLPFNDNTFVLVPEMSLKIISVHRSSIIYKRISVYFRPKSSKSTINNLEFDCFFVPATERINYVPDCRFSWGFLNNLLLIKLLSILPLLIRVVNLCSFICISADTLNVEMLVATE